MQNACLRLCKQMHVRLLISVFLPVCIRNEYWTPPPPPPPQNPSGEGERGGGGDLVASFGSLATPTAPLSLLLLQAHGSFRSASKQTEHLHPDGKLPIER